MDTSFRDLPVATFEEFKTALTALFNAHPLLAGLLSHPDGIQEQVDLWLILTGLQMEAESNGAPFVLSDLCDDVEDVLGTLVNYNNNSWNFDPNYTPAKVNYRLACMLVRCLLNQPGLLRVELDAFGSAGYPQLLVMYQGRKKVFLELWSWSDPEYYRHEEVEVSGHLTMGPATKRFEKVVKSWDPIQEEEE